MHDLKASASPSTEPSRGESKSPPLRQKSLNLNSRTIQLQSQLGNRATQRLWKKRHSSLPIQRQRNLPPDLKTGIESLSQISAGDVKVNYNSPLPATVNALAFTQGNQIHLGPGQEKHLPHEAWHTVQQKQQRVQSTGKTNGLPLNENPSLEHEADQMGTRALQLGLHPNSGTSQLGSSYVPKINYSPLAQNAPLQRITALQAGIIGPAYVQLPDQNLYNAPAVVNITQGHVYQLTLPQKTDKGAVIDAFSFVIRRIGIALQGWRFLDYNRNPPDPGGNPNADRRALFRENLRVIFSGRAFAHDGFFDTAPHSVELYKRLERDKRETARDDANIPMIDPFILQVVIPQTGTASDWVFDVNYSEASLGYIIRIAEAPHGITGTIHDAGTFDLPLQNALPLDNAFEFSSGHDTIDLRSVGDQIDTIASGQTNQQNHIGLDAITKIAAEGARFEPIRELGMDLSMASKFYAYNPDTHRIEYLTFLQLYANWGRADWFNRRYGISTQTVKEQTFIHGGNLGAQGINFTHDYDLSLGMPAKDIRRTMESLIDRIEAIEAKRNNLKASMDARKKSGRKFNQQSYDQQFRGLRQQLESFKMDLALYRRSYPAIYRDITVLV